MISVVSEQLVGKGALPGLSRSHSEDFTDNSSHITMTAVQVPVFMAFFHPDRVYETPGACRDGDTRE